MRLQEQHKYWFQTLICLAVVFSVSTTGAWQMKQPPLATQWTSQVDTNAPLPEYPRPQMVRSNWLNLNGIWQFQAGITNSDPVPTNQTLSSQILVPYPMESAISGVMQYYPWSWYRRTFEVPAGWSGQRIILHLDAVTWQSQVYVNGQSVGVHQGGYDPFSYEITPYLNGGTNELLVHAYSPEDNGGQPRGKQTIYPGGIMYTSSSGIWQPVWLEPVDPAGIQNLQIIPDVDNARLRLTVNTYTNGGVTIMATALANGVSINTVTGAPQTELDIPVPTPNLWSPNNPFLYDLQVSVVYGGATNDLVTSYFGMRKISTNIVNGVPLIYLNNQPIFGIGPLDQGYWPDGIYTAPTDGALAFDLQEEKALGFNSVRKHEKVERQRWYYWADKLGLMVWQDMPTCNSYTGNTNPPAVNPLDFIAELSALVTNHWNSPCIIMWDVFNEDQGEAGSNDGVGQTNTPYLCQLVKTLDPSRLVNEASGGAYFGAGDVLDNHSYPAPGDPTSTTQAAVDGEFGGIGLLVPGHMWDPAAAFVGYVNATNAINIAPDYDVFVDDLIGYKPGGLNAAIYTQITDVENECDGLLNYDRTLKVDPTELLLCNQQAITGQFQTTTVVPTSQSIPQTWQWTTNTPAVNWYATNYNASYWNTGLAGFGTTDPGVTPNTPWTTPGYIYLRRTFNPGELTAAQIANLTFTVYHDEDVAVYINGVPAASASGFTTTYVQLAMTPQGQAAIIPNATNLLAVSCLQTTGGQFIDVGIVLQNLTANTLAVPTDYIGCWPLDATNGTVAVDATGNGDNGTVNGATWNPDGQINGCLSFNGINNNVQINNLVSNDFSIACWVKTTQTGGTGQWYAGAGLVDGYSSVVANDFGTALSGGKFAFGVGNPNTTILSTNLINDGAWHQCVATRVRATGALNIYVDGNWQADGAGNTNFLNSSEDLLFGAIASGGGYFNGSLDEIQIYNRALGNNEITALYSNGTLPPAMPTNVLATAGNVQVTLIWNAPLFADQYTVSRSTSSGGPYAALATTTTPAYTDTSVVVGNTYYYVVSAVNTFGASANSSPVSATFPLPSAPTGLSATAGNLEVDLNWNASVDAQAYNVSRSTVNNGPYPLLAGGVTATSYVDTAATNGVTYYYVVAATAGQVTTANSSQVSATPGVAVSVACYPFTNSANLGADSSGQGNTLTTASGSPAYSAAGKFTGALYLNGSSTMKTLSGNFPNGVPTGANPYTITVWEKAATNCPNHGGFVGWGDNTTSQANDLRLNGANSVDDYWYNNDFVVTGLAANPMDGNWHLIAVAWNGTLQTMYVDGVNVGTRTPTAPNVQPANFIVGATTADVDFAGWLDDLTIYNQALTAAEIGVLAGLTPSTPEGLTAVGINSGWVALSWSAVPGVTNYSVWRSKDNGATFQEIATGLPTASYTDVNASTGLTNGQSVFYEVAAANINGTSANSAAAGVVVSDLINFSPNTTGAVVGSNAMATLSVASSVTAASPVTLTLTSSNLSVTASQTVTLPVGVASTNLSFPIAGIGVATVSATGPGLAPASLTVNGYLTTIWSGAVNNVWDINATTNWIQNTVPSVYLDGAPVIFDDTGGNAAIYLATNVSPQSLAFNNHSVNYSFGGGGIGGSGSLVLNGSGSVTLNNINTYGGATILNAGRLVLFFTNCPVRLWNADTITGANGSSLTATSWRDAVGLTYLVQDGSDAFPTLTNGDAAFNGHKSVAFNGSQALELAAANNPIPGATGWTIAVVFNPHAAGVNSGAWYNQTFLFGHDIPTVQNDYALTWDSNRKVEMGIGNPDNNWPASNASALNTGHVAIYTWSTNGLLTLTVDGVLTTISQTATAVRAPAIAEIGINGLNANIANVQLYTNALSTKAVNALGYTLDQIYGLSGFAVPAGLLPASTALQVAAGATFDLNGVSQPVGSLANIGGSGGSVTNSGGAANSPVTLMVGNDNTSTSFSGNIQNGAAGIALIKTGAGELTLSGTNTYTGGTTIAGGELAGVTGGSLSNSVVTVAAGATNGVQVTATGGQWVIAGLTNNAGATCADFEFGAVAPSPTTAPLQVNGNVTFNGALNVIVRGTAFPASGTVPLLKYTGALAGTPPTNLVTLPVGMATGTLVNDTANHSIDLAFAASSNAYLTSLVLNPAGILSPTFASNTFAYTATEIYGTVPSVTVTNADLTATNLLIYQSTTNLLASGVPSAAPVFNLVLGVTNVVTVQVTAHNGVTVQTYTVNVTELPNQTSQPQLLAGANGGSLDLIWSADRLGYRLLVQTNHLDQGLSGNPTDWATVPGSTQIISTNLSILNTNVNEYYRLVYP